MPHPRDTEPHSFDIKNGASSFEQVAIAIGGNYNLTADGAEPERVGTIRALAGGALALAFAAVSLSRIRRLGASSVPRINEIPPAVSRRSRSARCLPGDREPSKGERLRPVKSSSPPICGWSLAIISARGRSRSSAGGSSLSMIRARPVAILWLIGRQTALLAAAGVASGLAGALAVTGFIQSLLFEVAPRDPATFTAIAAFLGLIALAAGLVPAGRAARIDPLRSRRSQ